MTIDEVKGVLSRWTDQVVQTRIAMNAVSGHIEKMEMVLDDFRKVINDMQRSEVARGGNKPANLGPPKELPIPPRPAK